MIRAGSAFLNTGVLCCTFFLSAGVAEVVLRLTNVSPPVRMGWVGKQYDPPGPELTADPDTGWKMKPNQAFVWRREGQDDEYRANSAGFRSGHEFDPSDGRYSIALVGDSYTWGSGAAYQDTFAALLEKDSLDKVVSWNFGILGFGVDQVWLSARHKALPMHPDLLVVGLINADFERSQIPHREGYDKPTFRLKAENWCVGRWNHHLRRGCGTWIGIRIFGRRGSCRSAG
jgi:hypothetical protein